MAEKVKLTKEEKQELAFRKSLGRLCDENCVLIVIGAALSKLDKCLAYKNGMEVIFVDDLEECLTYIEISLALGYKITILITGFELRNPEYCASTVESLIIYYGADVDVKILGECFLGKQLKKFITVSENVGIDDVMHYVGKWKPYARLQDTGYRELIESYIDELSMATDNEIVEYLGDLSGRDCYGDNLPKTTKLDYSQLDTQLDLVGKELMEGRIEAPTKGRK